METNFQYGTRAAPESAAGDGGKVAWMEIYIQAADLFRKHARPFKTILERCLELAAAVEVRTTFSDHLKARTFLGLAQYDDALAILDSMRVGENNGWHRVWRALALEGLGRVREGLEEITRAETLLAAVLPFPFVVEIKTRLSK